VNADGHPCEILERVTWQHTAAGQAEDEATVVNRRFDLKTGERLNRLSDDEFEDDLTGARLRLQR
jgi:hypothetical protein